MAGGCSQLRIEMPCQDRGRVRKSVIPFIYSYFINLVWNYLLDGFYLLECEVRCSKNIEINIKMTLTNKNW